MRYSWNVCLWKIKYNWSYLIIYSNNMKAYLNLVDKKLIQKQVWEILELEQLIENKSGVYVNSEVIQEELEYLLDIDNVIKTQKYLIESRYWKKFFWMKYKKWHNKFEIKLNKIILRWIKHKYKKLNSRLEEYRKFLKIVFVSKLSKEIVFKWLDKDEFNSSLDTNIFIKILLEDWNITNNIKSWKRDLFYTENLIKLRNIMHELDN